MTTLQVSQADFDEQVLKADRPVVVDFWAEWCGPCKMIAPALEELAGEMQDVVKIAKVNIDDNPDLAVQYGIRSIPALMVFKDGEIAANKVGADTKSGLKSWIDAAI